MAVVGEYVVSKWIALENQLGYLLISLTVEWVIVWVAFCQKLWIAYCFSILFIY